MSPNTDPDSGKHPVEDNTEAYAKLLRELTTGSASVLSWIGIDLSMY